MSEKITYIFPSRSRTTKFLNCLKNITELSEDANYEIIAVLDQDDIVMNRVEIVDAILEYRNVKVFAGLSKGKIDVINREIDKVQGKIICLHSDDMVFTKKGFDNDIRAAFADGFTGLVHWPDQMQGERLCTYPIMHIDYLKMQGYIYNPEYRSVYADDEETQKAKLRGKYKFINEQLFIHNHWLFGLSEKDSLNAQNDSPEMYAHDKAVFERRKKINFGL